MMEELERYRREIRFHCYRMLGSIHDAEDLVQETFLRAWRNLESRDPSSSLRSWLYRIASNLCLTALAKRASRVLPTQIGPSTRLMPKGPSREIAWLTPVPWDQLVDSSPGPEARYATNESVRLAFIAALQRLPACQRAALLLQDVLAFPAQETARLLETSVPAVNSALQRARANLARQQPSPVSEPNGKLLERYLQAWEQQDLDGLISLLSEEAVLAMPPYMEWYQGRQAIRDLLAWAWGLRERGPSRMLQIYANGQQGFAHLVGGQPHMLHLPLVRQGKIAELTLFHDTSLFEFFGLK